MARPTDRHVKKTLPPSLNGLPGEAEIRYYVKTTVQRPAFYKENFRAVCAISWQASQEYFKMVDGTPFRISAKLVTDSTIHLSPH